MAIFQSKQLVLLVTLLGVAHVRGSGWQNGDKSQEAQDAQLDLYMSQIKTLGANAKEFRKDMIANDARRERETKELNRKLQQQKKERNRKQQQKNEERKRKQQKRSAPLPPPPSAPAMMEWNEGDLAMVDGKKVILIKKFKTYNPFIDEWQVQYLENSTASHHSGKLPKVQESLLKPCPVEKKKVSKRSPPKLRDDLSGASAAAGGPEPTSRARAKGRRSKKELQRRDGRLGKLDNKAEKLKNSGRRYKDNMAEVAKRIKNGTLDWDALAKLY